MSKNKKNMAIPILLVLCAVLTAFAAGGCRKIETPDDDPAKDIQSGSEEVPKEMDVPALQIETTDEDNTWVTVRTTYGVVRYLSAFSDIVAVTAVQHEAASQLLFTADIGEKEIPLYTIRYNEEGEGIALGTLKLSAKAVVPVSVTFSDAPAELTGNDLATFVAAQETFNDVLTSIMEDSRFTMAE